jgi:SRSO17 transposase
MTTEIVFPGIEDYMAPYYGYFHRSESRELAECYLVGLLMDAERKSVEPMSEKVNASERSMQRLLSTAKPSLPDVRHQIAKLLVRILKC